MFEAITAGVLPAAGGADDQDPDLWAGMMIIRDEQAKARLRRERQGR